MDHASGGSRWSCFVALVAAAGLVGLACGGRDHAIPRPDARADRGVERPVDDVGAAGEVTGAAGAGPTDAGDGPADLVMDIVTEFVEKSDAAAPPSPDAAAKPDAEAKADAEADSGSKAGSTATGKTCQRDADCASGHCREGVCCDGACSEKCQSCLNAKTGKADGTCAPVKAGVSHGSDCIAADATTCGLDGTCDGAGACRQHVVGTPCAQESCSDGVSVATYSSARNCNGAGTCAAAMTSNCSATYRCGGTKCRTTCAATQDCVTGAYCSGNACLAKKADKELCSSNAECLTGTCGGRCCAAGCSCTQPSAGNLIKNSGVDTDTNGWRISSGTATLSRSLSDAEKCPYSGSLTLTVVAKDYASLSQCVSNTPFNGDFNFGLQARLFGAGQVVCQVRFYSGFNCDADLITTNETLAQTADYWQESMPETLSAPVVGANSVVFECSIYGGLSGETTVTLDMFYLSKVPTRY